MCCVVLSQQDFRKKEQARVPFWFIRIRLVLLCAGGRLEQNTACFDVCSSPAAGMRWKVSCSRSKQLLAFTPDTHKGIEAFAFELTSRSRWQRRDAQCLIYSWERGRRKKKKDCWVIYQLYLGCTRITAANRSCSVLDPSVPREQRAWKSARSWKVSSAGSNLSCSHQWSKLIKILSDCLNPSGSKLWLCSPSRWTEGRYTVRPWGTMIRNLLQEERLEDGSAGKWSWGVSVGYQKKLLGQEQNPAGIWGCLRVGSLSSCDIGVHCN